MRTPQVLRAPLLVAIAVVAWSWSDVLLWQRVFEGNGLYRYQAPYEVAHPWELYGLIALAVVAMLPDLMGAGLVAIATYTLAYGGAADALYYALDGRPIPATLPWLDDSWHYLLLGHPATATSVLASTLLWISFWAMLLVVYGRRRDQHRGPRPHAGGPPAC